jgi:hypothetical protein
MSNPRRPKSTQSTTDPFDKSKPDRALVPNTPSLFDEELLLDPEDAPAAEPSSVVGETQPSPEAPATPAAAKPRPTATAPAPAPPAPAASDSSPAVEEFDPAAASARRKARREEASLPSVQQPLHPQLDRIGRIAAFILVPLLFVAVFYTILNKGSKSEAPVAKAKPTLPLEGKLVKISELTTGWRQRNDADRVSPEAQLLTKATVYPSELPELRLKLAPSAPNAFLRILFLNSEGKIAGDPKVIKVVDGKIQLPGTSGDTLINDSECKVAASTGLQSTRHLNDYLRSNQQRWSIEISESADYQAKGDDWKLLDTFAVADINL